MALIRIFILVDSIREKLQQIRTLKLQEGKTMNRLLADVEYQLTAAYLSYVCQLKFGFLPSERRWNDSINRIPLKHCDEVLQWPLSIHCVQIQMLLFTGATFFPALSQDAGRTGSCECLGRNGYYGLLPEPPAW